MQHGSTANGRLLWHPEASVICWHVVRTTRQGLRVICNGWQVAKMKISEKKREAKARKTVIPSGLLTTSRTVAAQIISTHMCQVGPDFEDIG